MSRPPWNEVIYEPRGTTEDGPTEAPSLLISLHFLVDALKRRRLLVALMALCGTALAVLYLVLSPTAYEARTALLLVNDPQQDPARTAATDLSLINSRVVAERTIENLGLDTTVEDFNKSIAVTPDSASLVVLTLTASSHAEAVRRLSSFCTEYLDFRGAQITAQPDALMNGMSERVSALQKQADKLTKRINSLRLVSDTETTQLNELVGERAQLIGQINTLEGQISEIQLRNQSIIAGSRVVDPAAPQPSSTQLHGGLTLLSGLIGGTAIGVGFVLVSAIMSTTLRRRDEVAIAVRAPVLLSVGSLSRLPDRLASLRPLRRMAQNRERDLARLVNTLELSLPSSWRGQRLTVACIDNAKDVAHGLVRTALDLQGQGRTVHLLDLTEGAHLAREVRRTAIGGAGLTLWLPQTVPSFAQDPADLFPVGADVENQRYELRQSDIALVIVDVDPAVPPDHISAFSDRVVLAVTAGHSSAERLRGASDLLSRTGVDVYGAVLLRTRGSDESHGLVRGTAAQQTEQPALSDPGHDTWAKEETGQP